MKVTITVTQDDIENGRPADPCTCPAALAISRVLPDCFNWVDGMAVELNVDGDTITVDAPEELAAFIEAFDSPYASEHPQLKPFSFELDVPGVLGGVR